MSNKRKLEPTDSNIHHQHSQDGSRKRLASPSLVQEKIASLHITPSNTGIAGTAGDMADLHQSLVKEYQKGNHADRRKLNETLNKLKVEMSKTGLLFPSLAQQELSEHDMVSAREVLEIGAYASLEQGDMPAFERYLALLRSYYDDMANRLPKSQNQDAIEALALLRLLSQNKIADFHTTLETLPFKVLESNEVKWVTRLETALMEGAYSRVWSSCSRPSNLPRPEFALFTQTLIGTVRAEIAACDERAYSTLTLADARTSLFFDTDDAVRSFAKERGWHVDGKGVIHFASSPLHPRNFGPTATATATGTGSGAPDSIATGGAGAFDGSGESRELNKEQIVRSALYYAKNLDTIV